MKLFRLRFIILGLLLCIFHVWCRTCNSDFNDPMSNTYRAEIVIQGRITQRLPTENGRYDVSVLVQKYIKGFVGKEKRIRVTQFAPEVDEENCISNVTKGRGRYVFYLNSTENPGIFVNIALPDKVTKKLMRQVRKMACASTKCAKAPFVKKIQAKKPTIGRPLMIKCQIKPVKPIPLFQWLKDGQLIEKRRGLSIKSNRRSSRLKISRASKEDDGEYTCVARNVVGNSSRAISIQVKPKTQKPAKETTTGATTTTRYIKCPPQLDGYCLNGGECLILKSMDMHKCQCPSAFTGYRCAINSVPTILTDVQRKDELKKDTTVTIIGIFIGILLFVCICIASYFLAKRKRERFRKAKANIPQEDRSIPERPRPPMVSAETQTDDCVYDNDPESNAKDLVILRNPSPHIAAQTSRNRLSGISINGKQQRNSAGVRNSALANGRASNNLGQTQNPEDGNRCLEEAEVKLEPKQNSQEPMYSNTAGVKGDNPSGPTYAGKSFNVPKISTGSIYSSEDDEDNDDLTKPLFITEDDLGSRHQATSMAPAAPIVLNGYKSSRGENQASGRNVGFAPTVKNRSSSPLFEIECTQRKDPTRGTTAGNSQGPGSVSKNKDLGRVGPGRGPASWDGEAIPDHHHHHHHQGRQFHPDDIHPRDRTSYSPARVANGDNSRSRNKMPAIIKGRSSIPY